MRFALAVFIALSLSAGGVCAQRGAYSLPVDLDQMVRQAQTIVRGHVVSAKVEPHPQFSEMRTVVVTFKVDRVLKGSSVATITVRQFIWDVRDVSDAAGYRKADELLLLLNPTSSYGLTSPVGLDQGRFRIERDTSGNVFALNGRSNAGLFTGVLTKATSRGISFTPQARVMLNQPVGRVSLATLEDTIQTIGGAH